GVERLLAQAFFPPCEGGFGGWSRPDEPACSCEWGSGGCGPTAEGRGGQDEPAFHFPCAQRVIGSRLLSIRRLGFSARLEEGCREMVGDTVDLVLKIGEESLAARTRVRHVDRDRVAGLNWGRCPFRLAEIAVLRCRRPHP